MEATSRPGISTRRIVLAAVWLVAMVAIALAVRRHVFPPQPVLLGDEYVNAEAKLSFRPPVGWKASPMPEELARGFLTGRPLVALHFEGRQPGDFCTLFLVESDQPLEQIALQALRSRPKGTDRDIEDKFFELNGLEAWGCEWIMRQQAVIHQLNVVVRRGSQRLAIVYGAVETSYRRQERAIAASLRSLKFQ
jgi:hypothetical protein